MRSKFAALLLLLPAAAFGYPSPQDSGATQSQSSTKPPMRIRIGGNVMTAKIVQKVQPVYPPLARQTRIQGTVRLHAIIGKDGLVKQLEVISGHPALLQSALDAVRKWQYEPVLLNGEPVEVDTTIDVIYALNQDSGASAPPNKLDPQLKEDILHLMDVTHFRERAAESGQRVMDTLRPVLLKSLPETQNREAILDAYQKKLLGLTQTDEFRDEVVGIYAKYFSDEDVKAITEFYGTPAGQKFNNVLGDFAADLNQAGQRVARENIPAILKELCTEYSELEGSSLCPTAKPEKSGEVK